MPRANACNIGSEYGNKIYPLSKFMREKCSVNVHKLTDAQKLRGMIINI